MTHGFLAMQRAFLYIAIIARKAGDTRRYKKKDFRMVPVQGPRRMTREALFDASILLISNDPKASAAIGDMLTQNGFTVRWSAQVAANPSTEAPSPDLIILDRPALDMGNAEILDQLHAHKGNEEIPFFLVGPQDDISLKESAFAAGAADWLDAPVQEFELLAKMATHLELHRLRNSRNQLGHELADAREQAETAIRAKNKFLSHMSHELRTPLNAILGFSRLMEHNPNLTASQVENLGLIYQSGENLLRLINDALEMSKIDTGNVTLNPTVIDLPRLLQGVVVMFQSRAAEQGLSISLDLAANVPRFVKCDEPKLQQILVNLVGNSLKFADEGEIEIRVRNRSEAAALQTNDPDPSEEPCDLAFEVRDSGPGISPNEAERIFEPFFKGRQGTGKRGTGLGLTISRKFARMMGGDITAANGRDRGARFTFNAWVEPATAEAALSKNTLGRVVGIEGGKAENRVLVVDDDNTNRMLLSRILANAGMAVEKAASGEEAIEMFSRWRPDIVFMDLHMPKMDGLTATRHIKTTEKGRQTPIIALIPRTFEQDRQKILSAGCDDYLRKPVDEQQLFNLMGKQLGLTFIRDSSAPPPSPSPKGAAIAMDAMADLPTSMLAEIRKAALDLDLERVKACLDQIQASHPALRSSLSRLSSEFRFEEIYNLCDGALKSKV
jgi:signal transduction histidine kinase/ActR/RegA family two-component response regulator